MQPSVWRPPEGRHHEERRRVPTNNAKLLVERLFGVR